MQSGGGRECQFATREVPLIHCRTKEKIKRGQGSDGRDKRDRCKEECEWMRRKVKHR